MKVLVLAVGRLKEAHYRAAQDEYADRLSHYCTLTIRDLRDSVALIAAIPDRARLILLDERGESLSSRDWSKKIIGESELRGGSSPLVFALGGADGLPPALAPRALHTLSFGRATLPHRLARIVLLEQIYRAFTILRGAPYHHD